MTQDRLLFLTGALLQGRTLSALGPAQIKELVGVAAIVLAEVERKSLELIKAEEEARHGIQRG